MKLLEDTIRAVGQVQPNNVLKVDAIINHQIDPALLMAMGADMYAHYKEAGVTRILTLEVSGIAIAFAAATYFNVPVVFAKKIASLTLSPDVYVATVDSYTKQTRYDIRVDKRFLQADDRVLIIDDFLAKGEALRGLISLCEQAGAEIAGIGIAIEKAFQDGGRWAREQGYPIYSQARIASLANQQIEFVTETE